MKNYKFNFKVLVGMLLMLFVGCTLSFAASDYDCNIGIEEGELQKEIKGTNINNDAVLKEYEEVSDVKRVGCTCSDKCVCRKKCKYGTCYVDPKLFFITGNEPKKCEIPKKDSLGVPYADYDKVFHVTGNGEKRHRCKLIKEFDIDGTELEKAREAKKKTVRL